jgi:hypothetical protein
MEVAPFFRPVVRQIMTKLQQSACVPTVETSSTVGAPTVEVTDLKNGASNNAGTAAPVLGRNNNRQKGRAGGKTNAASKSAISTKRSSRWARPSDVVFLADPEANRLLSKLLATGSSVLSRPAGLNGSTVGDTAAVGSSKSQGSNGSNGTKGTKGTNAQGTKSQGANSQGIKSPAHYSNCIVLRLTGKRMLDSDLVYCSPPNNGDRTSHGVPRPMQQGRFLPLLQRLGVREFGLDELLCFWKAYAATQMMDQTSQTQQMPQQRQHAEVHCNLGIKCLAALVQLSARLVQHAEDQLGRPSTRTVSSASQPQPSVVQSWLAQVRSIVTIPSNGPSGDGAMAPSSSPGGIVLSADSHTTGMLFLPDEGDETCATTVLPPATLPSKLPLTSMQSTPGKKSFYFMKELPMVHPGLLKSIADDEGSCHNKDASRPSMSSPTAAPATTGTQSCRGFLLRLGVVPLEPVLIIQHYIIPRVHGMNATQELPEDALRQLREYARYVVEHWEECKDMHAAMAPEVDTPAPATGVGGAVESDWDWRCCKGRWVKFWMLLLIAADNTSLLPMFRAMESASVAAHAPKQSGPSDAGGEEGASGEHTIGVASGAVAFEAELCVQLLTELEKDAAGVRTRAGAVAAAAVAGAAGGAAVAGAAGGAAVAAGAGGAAVAAGAVRAAVSDDPVLQLKIRSWIILGRLGKCAAQTAPAAATEGAGVGAGWSGGAGGDEGVRVVSSNSNSNSTTATTLISRVCALRVLSLESPNVAGAWGCAKTSYLLAPLPLAELVPPGGGGGTEESAEGAAGGEVTAAAAAATGSSSHERLEVARQLGVPVVDVALPLALARSTDTDGGDCIAGASDCGSSLEFEWGWYADYISMLSLLSVQQLWSEDGEDDAGHSDTTQDDDLLASKLEALLVGSEDDALGIGDDNSVGVDGVGGDGGGDELSGEDSGVEIDRSGDDERHQLLDREAEDARRALAIGVVTEWGGKATSMDGEKLVVDLSVMQQQVSGS